MKRARGPLLLALLLASLLGACTQSVDGIRRAYPELSKVPLILPVKRYRVLALNTFGFDFGGGDVKEAVARAEEELRHDGLTEMGPREEHGAWTYFRANKEDRCVCGARFHSRWLDGGARTSYEFLYTVTSDCVVLNVCDPDATLHSGTAWLKLTLADAPSPGLPRAR